MNAGACRGRSRSARWVDQRRQVLQPLAQRRQADREHVEPEEQVLAEVAVRDGVLEPAIGGRHDAHVHPLRGFGAQPLQLPGLERAQQLGLRVRAQVADLVEEQRPLVRQLEPAQPPLGGAGEGAPLVAEHLGLHQVARDGGAVDGDEGAPAAPARRVHRRRGQLLARAALAGQQHARLGRRHAGDQRAHLLHRRTLAHERRATAELRLERPVLRPGPVELERRAHGHQYRLGSERLLQELERAQLHRPHRVGELRLAAHHDHRGATGHARAGR